MEWKRAVNEPVTLIDDMNQGVRHTSGPWVLSSDEKSVKITGADGAVLVAGFLQGRPPNEELLANGHLIAAAPEMLAALEEHVRWMKSNKDEHTALLEQVIAKAKGGI